MGKSVLIVIGVLLLALSVGVIAADAAGVAGLSDWETLATQVCAGTIGMFIAQAIKERLPAKWITTRTMTYIGYVAAFASALVAFLVTGGWSLITGNPVAAIKGLLEAGGFMTLAYATISKSFGLNNTAVQEAKAAAAALAAARAGDAQ